MNFFSYKPRVERPGFLTNSSMIIRVASERVERKENVEVSCLSLSPLLQVSGTEIKRVPSVAEPFYAIFLPGCNSKGNLPFASKEASPYDPNAPVEVEVSKDIFFTYRVR